MYVGHSVYSKNEAVYDRFVGQLQRASYGYSANRDVVTFEEFRADKIGQYVERLQQIKDLPINHSTSEDFQSKWGSRKFDDIDDLKLFNNRNFGHDNLDIGRFCYVLRKRDSTFLQPMLKQLKKNPQSDDIALNNIPLSALEQIFHRLRNVELELLARQPEKSTIPTSPALSSHRLKSLLRAKFR